MNKVVYITFTSGQRVENQYLMTIKVFKT